MSSIIAKAPLTTKEEVAEAVVVERHRLHETLNKLGSHRRESKPGRAGVGQCIYTIFEGNIDGLRVWRQYCASAASPVPLHESTEFWFTAKENYAYGFTRLESWIREDRAAELLEQLSPKRRAEKDPRLAVGQVLYNAFNGEAAGRSLWMNYCRAGRLSKEELQEAEEFWQEATKTKDPPRLLKDWAMADNQQNA